jgi:hypothetical protein
MTTLKEDINRILNLMLLEKKTIDIEEVEENELSEDEDEAASGEWWWNIFRLSFY